MALSANTVRRNRGGIAFVGPPGACSMWSSSATCLPYFKIVCLFCIHLRDILEMKEDQWLQKAFATASGGKSHSRHIAETVVDYVYNRVAVHIKVVCVTDRGSVWKHAVDDTFYSYSRRYPRYSICIGYGPKPEPLKTRLMNMIKNRRVFCEVRNQRRQLSGCDLQSGKR